ncbi:hypothetical protein SLEP1_g6854 [Rubroshorea leprosula]|uniref:Uncharacterized protein n=1 Tax=Rubroshorea leprosula TaxID=152421 RepID=A0AAV5I6I4_9ROSI|nr:hypothetical protein SLEP1_g6854 [Rubroshorea leprosula]
MSFMLIFGEHSARKKLLTSVNGPHIEPGNKPRKAIGMRRCMNICCFEKNGLKTSWCCLALAEVIRQFRLRNRHYLTN